MPHDEWTFRIEHMINAIDAIAAATDGMSFADFQRNRLVRDAVLWNLQILGEAVSHLPENVIAEHPHVPWRIIRATRNIIVHAYDRINERIIWDTISDDLPPLRIALQTLLNSMD